MTGRPDRRRLSLNAELRDPTGLDGAESAPAPAQRSPARSNEPAPARGRFRARATAGLRSSNGAGSAGAAASGPDSLAATAGAPARRRSRQVWARFSVGQWQQLQALKHATGGAGTPASLLSELIDRHLPDDANEVVELVQAYDRARVEQPETAEHVFRVTPGTHAKLVRVEAAVKRQLDWATRADVLGALLAYAAPTTAAEARQRLHHHERLRRHGASASDRLDAPVAWPPLSTSRKGCPAPCTPPTTGISRAGHAVSPSG